MTADNIYSNPNLEGELHQFLIRHSQLAQELAKRTQDLGPKESMAVIAQAMWESQWAGGKPARQPGQWNCLCGKVISRNKQYCKGCQERTQTNVNTHTPDVPGREESTAGPGGIGQELHNPGPSQADQ